MICSVNQKKHRHLQLQLLVWRGVVLFYCVNKPVFVGWCCSDVFIYTVLVSSPLSYMTMIHAAPQKWDL